MWRYFPARMMETSHFSPKNVNCMWSITQILNYFGKLHLLHALCIWYNFKKHFPKTISYNTRSASFRYPRIGKCVVLGANPRPLFISLKLVKLASGQSTKFADFGMNFVITRWRMSRWNVMNNDDRICQMNNDENDLWVPLHAVVREESKRFRSVSEIII